MRFLDCAWAVFLREARQELRRRSSVSSVVFFAVVALVLISLAVTTLTLPAADAARLNSGMLWILLFFCAASGLPRSFVREEDAGTAIALRKAVAAPAVLLGKLAFNFLLFSLICAVAAPLLLILEGWKIHNAGAFGLVLLLTGYGFSLVATFLSAIVSRAGQKDVLFVLIAFPLLAPLLLPAVDATARAALAPSFLDLDSYWRVLISYDGLATIAAFLLMRFIWEG